MRVASAEEFTLRFGRVCPRCNREPSDLVVFDGVLCDDEEREVKLCTICLCDGLGSMLRAKSAMRPER